MQSLVGTAAGPGTSCSLLGSCQIPSTSCSSTPFAHKRSRLQGPSLQRCEAAAAAAAVCGAAWMQPRMQPRRSALKPSRAVRAACCSSSACQQQQQPFAGPATAAVMQQRMQLPLPLQHSRQHSSMRCASHPSVIRVPCCSTASCMHSSIQRPTGSPTASRAGRGLTPPSASLAFAEPATQALGTASVAAAGATAAAGTSFSVAKFLAVLLGYCVMAGSLFRSVPQIVKVIQHNSTEGLSLMSYVVELCCYSVVIAYNLSQGYGFNTFGEVVACWIQDVILIALVFRDRHTPLWQVLLAAAAFAAGCGLLLSPSCPQQLLSTLQASNIAIMAFGSRLPQILLNMQRGNAGMLSVTTCLLNVAGNAARIFTTIVLTGDVLMLGGACSQGCLNTILLYQSVTTARARAAAAAAASSNPSSSSSAQQKRPKQQPDVVSGPKEDPSGGLAALQPAT